MKRALPLLLLLAPAWFACTANISGGNGESGADGSSPGSGPGQTGQAKGEKVDVTPARLLTDTQYNNAVAALFGDTSRPLTEQIQALGELYDVVHVVNRMATSLSKDSPAADLADYRAGVVVLKELSRILGLFRTLPRKPEVGGDALTGDLLELLIELRARLRKEKNFALADEVRNRLTALGVALEDGPQGTRWRIEPKR